MHELSRWWLRGVVTATSQMMHLPEGEKDHVGEYPLDGALNYPLEEPPHKEPPCSPSLYILDIRVKVFCLNAPVISTYK